MLLAIRAQAALSRAWGAAESEGKIRGGGKGLQRETSGEKRKGEEKQT